MWPATCGRGGCSLESPGGSSCPSAPSNLGKPARFTVLKIRQSQCFLQLNDSSVIISRLSAEIEQQQKQQGAAQQQAASTGGSGGGLLSGLLGGGSSSRSKVQPVEQEKPCCTAEKNREEEEKWRRWVDSWFVKVRQALHPLFQLITGLAVSNQSHAGPSCFVFAASLVLNSSIVDLANLLVMGSPQGHHALLLEGLPGCEARLCWGLLQ
jgi:hypothetical protein